MTPAQAAARFARVGRELEANVLAAEAVTVKQGKAEAVRLSSGPLSTAQLRRMGHPYARRAPTSPNPQVINVQRGAFRAGWTGDGPTVTAGGVVSRIYNTSGEAKYLLGTRTAIARPIREAIIKAVQPDRIKRLNRAVRQAVKA